MDELGGFEPTDTSGFIQIESIRIKKFVASLYISFYIPLRMVCRWAQANFRKGQAGIEPKDVYGSRV